MAFVCRTNVTFCPLLNTFYCKCVVNRTFQTTICSNNKESHSGLTTFNKMLQFRKEQAKKSIILRVNDKESLNSFEHIVKKYGTIIQMYPYETSDARTYVLIELDTKTTKTQLIKHSNVHLNFDGIIALSPLFAYNSQQFGSATPLPRTLYRHFKKVELEPKKFCSLESLDKQMNYLYDITKMSELSIRLRFSTAELLSYYTRKLFVNIEVVPFGSSVNGFGQTGGDLDLLSIISPRSINSNWKNLKDLHAFSKCTNQDSREGVIAYLEFLSLLMKRCIPGITDTQNIFLARVPIIKFNSTVTNMECDLTASNTAAAYMAELLYILSSLDDRVKPLFFTIRKWAEVQKVTRDHAGHWITNFSLILLTIFYLQIKKILPPIKNLKTYLGSNSTNKKGNIWKSNDEYSLSDLLYGFFEYYSCFDFAMQGICVIEGKVQDKRQMSPLYLYNPFDKSLNVSHNVSSSELMRLVKRMQEAITMFDNQENLVLLQLLKMNHETPVSISKQNHENQNKIHNNVKNKSQNDAKVHSQVKPVEEVSLESSLNNSESAVATIK